MRRIIIGVVLLCLLGSMGVVVGEHLVISTFEQDSPLFTTRILRATKQQQNIITPEYLGRGTKNMFNLQIPEDYTAEVQQFLRIILTMDKKSVERWVAKRPLMGVPVEDVSHSVPQILPTSGYATACGRWVPGCYLKEILSMIIAFIKNRFQWPTYTWFCWQSGQVPCNVDIFNLS
jgi:hypothetical protein